VQIKQDSYPEPLPHALQYRADRIMIRLVEGRYAVLHFIQRELTLPKLAFP
jgi:hypothetical protein